MWVGRLDSKDKPITFNPMAILNGRKCRSVAGKAIVVSVFVFALYKLTKFEKPEITEETYRQIRQQKLRSEQPKVRETLAKPQIQPARDITKSWKSVWEDPLKKSRRSSLLPELYKYERPADSTYKLNETLSQQISLDRRVPDLRPPGCALITHDINSLPTVTVIFPFYNEALSYLFRAIHSVLNWTPGPLLKEIVLVDDCSKNTNLKEPLDRYIRTLPEGKVIIIRNPKREGLIRARMKGAAVATGDVLVFQDAHTEVTPGWIEPMLELIKKKPKTVVQPTVDPMDPHTLRWYEKGDINHSELWHGTFMWDMRYAWQRIDSKYSHWQMSTSDPYPNAVLVGCALTVQRKFFDEIGGFDQGLNVWGGENIELSLRTWMCGGQMYIHPCSRVGHVFKPFSYGFDGNKEQIIMKNNVRVVEAWMPDYSHYFYASTYVYPFKKVTLTPEEKLSLQKKKLQIRSMKCKPMSWYLKHVLPDQATPPPNVRYFGEIQNAKSSMCFFTSPDGYVALTKDCYTYSRLKSEAEYGITFDNRMTYFDKCVTTTSAFLLKVVPCEHTNNTIWKVYFELLPNHGMTTGKIKLKNLKENKELCLQQITNVADGVHLKEQLPQFLPCTTDPSNEWQQWSITYNFDYSLVPPKEGL